MKKSNWVAALSTAMLTSMVTPAFSQSIQDTVGFIQATLPTNFIQLPGEVAFSGCLITDVVLVGSEIEFWVVGSNCSANRRYIIGIDRVTVTGIGEFLDISCIVGNCITAHVGNNVVFGNFVRINSDPDTAGRLQRAFQHLQTFFPRITPLF